MNKRGGGNPKSLNQLADQYTGSEDEREEFIEDLKQLRDHTWHRAIVRRDGQLADRFPMQCAFLRRTRVEHPDPVD